MLTVIAGLVLALAGVLLWVAVLTIAHALAVFLVVTGLVLVLWYAVPARYYRRGRGV